MAAAFFFFAKTKNWQNKNKKEIIKQMVSFANLVRGSFENGDISSIMSPRAVLTWAENIQIFSDIDYALRLSFLNKCDDLEKPIIAEFYQRVFGNEISYSLINDIS